jgi:integrase
LNGKFPVKIIVTHQINTNGTVKYKQDPYKTGVTLSKDEFKKVFSKSVPFELRRIREDLLEQEKRITTEIDKIKGFIRPELLKNRITGDVVRVDSLPITLELGLLFDALISEYDRNGQSGSADSFRDAKGSFLRFAGAGAILDEFTVKKLEEYEKWMLSPVHKMNKESDKLKSNSLTTTGMYLRCLRRVFNVAIDAGIIPSIMYPFGGKNGYVIRSEETVKMALNESEKDGMFTAEITDPEERRYLAYWMFSYYCHGMNFTDMAHIRPEKIVKNILTYVREKTKRTVKTIKPHSVPMRAEAIAILQEYGQHKPYCFGIIDDSMDPATKRRKIKQWYRLTNKYVNRIAARLNIPFKVNTYNARHSVAKQLIEKGVHIQHISEIMTHTNLQTTQIYTRGMNIDKSKSITDLL